MRVAGLPDTCGHCLAARESEGLAAVAYHSEGVGTAYLEIPDFSLPEDQPRRILGRSLMSFIGAALGKVLSELTGRAFVLRADLHDAPRSAAAHPLLGSPSSAACDVRVM